MPSPDLHLLALGSVISVEITGSGAAVAETAVRSAWSWCLSDLGLPPQVWVEASYELGDSLESFMEGFTQRINYAAIESQAGSLLMLHACALADATGRVAALIAPSGTGKTTAALALGEEFGYLSDETAGVLPDGVVVPYPKPLSVIETPGQPKRQLSAGELGFTRPSGPFQIGALLHLSRRDSGPATIEEVPLLEALALLAPQTSFLTQLDRPLHRLADVITTCGGLRVVHYSAAADLAPVVSAALGAR